MTRARELANLAGVSETSLSNRNMITNGAQVIDQRNAGASVSGDGKFPVDRWKASKVGSGAFSMQQSSTTPSDFNHSVVCTVTTADTSIAASDEYSYRHFVEGFNFCHANWGTSSAYPITLSFWVRSSVTGTYAVGFRNNAGNRTNPSTYTISSANTWEYKTVTVAGDTTGTWEGATNNIGLGVIFSLGAGSNYQGTANTWNASGTWSTASATQWISTSSATWYVTGIQMELGSQSTPFEHRSYGEELAACQRYYETLIMGAGNFDLASTERTADDDRAKWDFKVRKRANCTAALGAGGSWGTGTPTFYNGTENVNFNRAGIFNLNGTGGTIGLVADSEL